MQAPNPVDTHLQVYTKLRPKLCCCHLKGSSTVMLPRNNIPLFLFLVQDLVRFCKIFSKLLSDCVNFRVFPYSCCGMPKATTSQMRNPHTPILTFKYFLVKFDFIFGSAQMIFFPRPTTLRALA